jgi:hypothetical protein
VPIYSDVIARLDEKAVQTVIGELEKQFEQGGAGLGQSFSRAFSSAAANFGDGLSDGIRDSVGHMGTLGRVAETVMDNISTKAIMVATGIGAITLAAVKVGEALYDVGERYDTVLTAWPPARTHWAIRWISSTPHCANRSAIHPPALKTSATS